MRASEERLSAALCAESDSARRPGPERNGARKTYRLGSATVEVVSNDTDVARWLSEFLGAWLHETPTGTADFSVRFTASFDECRKLASGPAGAVSHPVPFLCLDSGVLMLAGLTGPGGVTVLADEKGCFYRIDRDRLQVITEPRNRWARLGLMRVVRELLTLRALAQPAMIDLHAAAFVLDGRAVLIAGAKNAGKTTLLVHALVSGRAGLLANDRVLVNRGSGQVLGVPTVVRLRETTERFFPCLAGGMPGRAALRHAGELASGEASEEAFLTRSPAQLAERTGTTMIPQAPLGAIVFPRISAEVSGWVLEPMAPADAAARLRESRYGVRSGPVQRTLLHQIAGSPSEENAGDIERVAASVPVLECRLGPDAYRNGAETWLRALPLGEGYRTR